ncbi:hypothetical protein EDB86DRAFT_3091103 [Lactarius hatsudake]|nr:hypothetical protein EDB86DRAFT_3091103 [Lactarius hatsudake]
MLQENMRAIWAIHDRAEANTIRTYAASLSRPHPPVFCSDAVHVRLREAAKSRNPCAARGTVDIVDDALAYGVWITRARRRRGQELVEVRPNTWLAVV